ncbi:MAG: ABC transporter permease [Planctomycetota bacterium]
MIETVATIRLALRLAARSLARRPTESSLVLVTLFTAFWGCLQIVAIVTSMTRQVERDFLKLGVDVINVHPDLDPLKFFGHKLKVTDCGRFAEIVEGVAAPANLVPALIRADGKDEGKEESIVAIGTTSAWDKVLLMDFVWGRIFRDDEGDACVLDEWVAKRLGVANSASAEPERVTVSVAGKDVSLRVVGVVRDPFRIRERLEEFDASAEARSHVIRFMEYKNAYVPRSVITKREGIIASIIKVGAGRDPEADVELIREYLKEKESNAFVWSRRRWAENILGALDVAAAISNFLWIVILIVTGFIVVTVTFIVVRQRYPEIAIRRVEGARKGQITLQLVSENLFLSLLASALAVPACHWTSVWIEHGFLGVPVFLEWGDILLVGGSGAVIVALTTLSPARRAASLDPVNVLRNERR